MCTGAMVLVGRPEKRKKQYGFCIFLSEGGGARPSNIGNASCLATQPWAISVDRRGGFEQNSCTRERGAFSAVAPKWPKGSGFFFVFGASEQVPTYPRHHGPRPLGGGRGRDKSLPKGIGIVG